MWKNYGNAHCPVGGLSPRSRSVWRFQCELPWFRRGRARPRLQLASPQCMDIRMVFRVAETTPVHFSSRFPAWRRAAASKAACSRGGVASLSGADGFGMIVLGMPGEYRLNLSRPRLQLASPQCMDIRMVFRVAETTPVHFSSRFPAWRRAAASKAACSRGGVASLSGADGFGMIVLGMPGEYRLNLSMAANPSEAATHMKGRLQCDRATHGNGQQRTKTKPERNARLHWSTSQNSCGLKPPLCLGACLSYTLPPSLPPFLPPSLPEPPVRTARCYHCLWQWSIHSAPM